MSDSEAKPGTRHSTGLMAVAAAALLAVAAAVYLIADTDRKPEAPPTGVSIPSGGKITRDLATGSLTAFVIKPNRPRVPMLSFTDAEGKAKSINDWRGRVVLVNLWATWCAPCREEMPSLAALQHQLGSKDFEVVAISLDRKGAEVAAPFLKDVGSSNLALYLDPSTAILNQLQAAGLPASVLIDREGREIGRMLGPAEWSSPEALALIKAAITEESRPS